MDIELSSTFMKSARRLPRNERKRLSDCTEWFRNDINDSRLKTHPLSGKLKGLYSFSFTHSKRVLFTFVGKNTVLFLDVGTHGKVYK